MRNAKWAARSWSKVSPTRSFTEALALDTGLGELELRCDAEKGAELAIG
jgi:hypothetical protein